MKAGNTGLLVSILFLILLAAPSCQQNPVEEYGKKTIQTYKETQRFGNANTVENLKRAIQGFNAAEGRYPADLRELSEFTGIPLKEEEFNYDPDNGTITLRNN